jgi:glutaredoxin
MSETATGIDLYWRPGCIFCSSLRRKLDKSGVERVEHDIWSDPAAAAVVRRVANGNETVPTVVIGDIGLVNPNAREVLRVLGEHAPHLLPDDRSDDREASGAGPLGRLLARVRGG